MKWLMAFFIGVVGFMGFSQHTYNEEGVKETTAQILIDNDISGFSIYGINLPMSYTFLAQKVDGEVFIEFGGSSNSFTITATPIEGYPILSVFSPPTAQIEISGLELRKLTMMSK